MFLELEDALHGRRDVITPTANAENLAAKILNSKLVVIEMPGT